MSGECDNLIVEWGGSLRCINSKGESINIAYELNRLKREKHWHETEEGKKQFLDMLNSVFSFAKDGTIYCRECKNESVACMCMRMDDEEK